MTGACKQKEQPFRFRVRMASILMNADYHERGSSSPLASEYPEPAAGQGSYTVPEPVQGSNAASGSVRLELPRFGGHLTIV